MNQKIKFKESDIGLVPKDWDVITFRDILSQNIKHGIYKSKKHFDSQGTRILKMGAINTSDRISDQKMERVTVNEDEIKRFKINEGNIIFARTSMMTGGLGNCSIVMKHNDPIVFDGNLMCVEIDTTIAEPKFYFYYFKSKYGQNEITKMTTGTQSRNIPGSKLMDVFVPITTKSEQIQIAKTLFDLDSKIESNQKMNKILEDMGKSLFKHWFIDFEFLNENDEPYKSSGGDLIYSEELGQKIPKQWRVGFLGDNILTKIIKPKIDKFDEKIYLDTSSVQNSHITKLDRKIKYDKRPSRANMQPKINTIWFVKMKESSKRLIFDIYSKYGLDNFILSAGLEVDESALYYIWGLISDTKFEKEKDNLSNGTTMQAINNNIKKIRIPVPNKTELIAFNTITKPIYQKIYENNIQSANLLQIRDTLLPKIILGKIIFN